jgi:hypothetical protein
MAESNHQWMIYEVERAKAFFCCGSEALMLTEKETVEKLSMVS